MQGSALMGHETTWYPLSFLGIENHFTAINAETVQSTWAVLLGLVVITLFTRYFLNKDIINHHQ